MSRFTHAMATSHTLSLAAMEEASRVGRRTADVTDLLLALVVSEQTAGQVLRSLGITLEDARAVIAEQHRTQLSGLGVEIEVPVAGPMVFDRTGGYDWDEPSLAVFAGASRGVAVGDASAVLRELLREPSGIIETVLQSLRVTPDAVASALDAVAPATAPAASAPKGERLTRQAEAFAPASIADVWALVSDPARLPEWDGTIGTVHADPGSPPRAGQSWRATARDTRPDGSAVRVKARYATQLVTLVTADAHDVTWRITTPDAPGANARRVAVRLEPAAGGTHVRVDFGWERTTTRIRRPWTAVLMAPLVRPIVWMQATQLAAGIARVFRDA